jgi:uncharacterized protein with NRDE domain
MCTLVIAKNIFFDYPLVAVTNRDELLDRPSLRPEIRDVDWQILAPKDLQRGGAWQGVNGSGLFVGLTNRIDVKSEPGRMSRGDIVMQALRHRSAVEAFIGLENLRGETLNGFNMVMADRKNMFLLRGDGKKIERTVEEDGLLVVTNHGVGRIITDSTPARVVSVLMAWRAYNLAGRRPLVKSLKHLLNIHGDHRTGTCINEPAHNYGTKSSSVVRLKNNASGFYWQYFHRERASSEQHICGEQFEPMIQLPIR